MQLRNLATSNSTPLFSGNYSSTARFDVSFTFLTGNDIKVNIGYDGSPGNPFQTTLTGFGAVPDNFRFFVADTNTGSNNNLYFNNLNVVPEPSVSLLMLSIGGLLPFRRNRRA